eukprot:150944-Amphidinium_carterae.2
MASDIAYDVQQFIPQEGLRNLPFHADSLAGRLVTKFKSMDFPDMDDEEVEDDTYATTDFNSAGYKAERSICVEARALDKRRDSETS